jgi:hypothetical protein
VTAPFPPAALSRSLAEQTAQRTDAPTDLRMGTVTAVTAFGIEVDVGGGTVTASHLDSYAPSVGHTVVLQRLLDAWVCLGRPIGSGTDQGGGSPGSGMGATVLGGATLGGSGTIASSTGAEVACPGMSMSFFHPIGHTVLLVAGFWWASSNSADWIITRWRVNHPSGGGILLGEWSEPVVNSGFGRYGVHMAVAPPTYGGPNRTYYLNMLRITGSGTTSISRNSGATSFVTAIDLGDSSLVKVA